MRKPRYIYCLEGNWNTNPRSKQSIRPILDILYYSAGIRYVYRKCNTKDEFFEYLQQFTFKRYKNYRILYIAFHGQPNGIQIGRDFVTLSEIADVLEGHLSGRIVHFGSCSSMRTKRANIDDFMNRTKANLVSGYRKQVDFIESTAWEMIYLYSVGDTGVNKSGSLCLRLIFHSATIAGILSTTSFPKITSVTSPICIESISLHK